MNIPTPIEHKRDGAELSPEEIGALAERWRRVGARIEPDEPLLPMHARTDQALAAVLPLVEKGIEVA